MDDYWRAVILLVEQFGTCLILLHMHMHRPLLFLHLLGQTIRRHVKDKCIKLPPNVCPSLNFEKVSCPIRTLFVCVFDFPVMYMKAEWLLYWQAATRSGFPLDLCQVYLGEGRLGF